jgi:manganese transport system permease protein
MPLLAFGCVAFACALLSLVVVTRRWAFIGEGIGHSGFGGAGTAWMLMCLVPALDVPWFPQVMVVLFSLATAMAMGAVSRRNEVTGDVSIGIFLVATVAWGFLGQRFYFVQRNADPAGFLTLFFGQPETVSLRYTACAISIALAVLLVMIMLRKEVLAYCLDPLLAEVSGVRAGVIHYLLIGLIAMATIIGMQVVGTLLVTALLVLPGATAQLLSKRLSSVTAIAVGVGLAGSIGGSVVHSQWPAVPVGPAFVLIMFAIFVGALVYSRAKRA